MGLFGPSLSSEEKAWRAGIGLDVAGKFCEALDQDNYERALHILKKHKKSGDEVTRMADKVAEKDAVSLIADFSNTPALMVAAAKYRNENLWQLANKFSQQSSDQQLNHAITGEWIEKIRDIGDELLKKNPSGIGSSSSSEFDNAFSKIMHVQSDDVFDAVIDLSFNLRYSYQSTLKQVLDFISIKGEAARISQLLRLSINKDNITEGFVSACKSGNQEAVKAYLGGITLDRDLKSKVYGNYLEPEIKAMIFPDVPEKKVPSPTSATTEKPVVDEQDRYTSPAIDVLAETLSLPNGISLTTVFNFTNAQQLIITEKNNVIDTKQIPFKDVDQAALANADAQLVKMSRRSEGASLNFFGNK